MAHRTDRDTWGEVRVPADAYWGPQTQRAVDGYSISGLRLQPDFIRAQGIVKRAAALANLKIDRLDLKLANAVVKAAEEVIEGAFNGQFVVDVFQGAGDAQNANANEVIANRASELLGGHKGDYILVHPEDHVNRTQSAHDTLATALHIATLEAFLHDVIPALRVLHEALVAKSQALDPVLEARRARLQNDAPMRRGQEFGAFARAVELGIARVEGVSGALKEVALGAEAPKGYREAAVAHLNDVAKLGFSPAQNPFEALWHRDAIVHASGALRTVAITLQKLAGDVRLLASGPGFGWLKLPELGVAEMLNQVCVQVMGCDGAVARSGAAGQLQQNAMLPVIAWNMLHAANLLANGIRSFSERCVDGITANVG